MRLHYRTKGFIFKKEERGEASRVFKVFTEDYGKLEIYGKSIRKIASKLKGGIEIFCLSEVEFIEGKTHKTLTDASFVKKFKGIAESPGKYRIAEKISKNLDNFLKGQEKDDELFFLIMEAFKELDEAPLRKDYCSLIYYCFLWNFFAHLGYKPEISKCVSCGAKLNPYGLYFSCKEGGILCKPCSGREKSIKLNSDALKILRILLKKDWEVIKKLRIGKLSGDMFEELSENYYKYILSSQSFEKI